MSTDDGRYVSSWERATAFQADAAAVSASQLRAAADVLHAIADVDLRQLERAMTCDALGNPITDTSEKQDAWAIYVEAMDVRDRAHGWTRVLIEAAERREFVEQMAPDDVSLMIEEDLRADGLL